MSITLRALCAMGCVLAGAALAQEFAYESKDWGIQPTTIVKRAGYHAPTPLEVPGGKTVKTVDLKAMLGQSPAPVLIDVLGEKQTVKGAIGMKGAGEGLLVGLDKEKFIKVLQTQTKGDKARALVFFCLSSECWLSYNAVLHALALGYTNVYWYRGGVNAWKGSSGELAPYKAAEGW